MLGKGTWLRQVLIAGGLLTAFWSLIALYAEISLPSWLHRPVGVTGQSMNRTAHQPLIQAQESLYQKENATLVTLCRNDDLPSLLQTVQSYEDRFNRAYHYDWVFLNNEEFTEEFKQYVSALVSGQAYFGKVGEDMWGYPKWVDKSKADEARKLLAEEGVIYGGSESYRHMCRFQAGFFFNHPLVQKYKYYWRVDADTKLFCDLDYDVFKFMRENKKTYGFVIALHELPATVTSLWKTVVEFLRKDVSVIHPNALREFVSVDLGRSYSMCHFWSNFEIADADFWRGDLYTRLFDHLDASGGFFYERWGDAPIHSIAASLFLDQSEIHFFDDIGYYHEPFYRAPENFVERGLKCALVPQASTEFSCLNYCRSLLARNDPREGEAGASR